MMEVSFYVELDNLEQLQKAKSGLHAIHPSVAVTFMDNTRDN
jgi:hypothetical protein